MPIVQVIATCARFAVAMRSACGMAIKGKNSGAIYIDIYIYIYIYICGCDYEEVGKKQRWRLGVPAFKREKRLSPPLRATCDADGYHCRSRRIDLPAPLAQPIVNRTVSTAKLQLGAVEAPVFNTIKHAYRV